LALVSRAKRPYVVDPINDLRPVCPNCHAMLHFGRSDPIPVDELRRRMSR
jgi:5-methylcytosine-specific restriction protein A